jgi:hypothetical protein
MNYVFPHYSIAIFQRCRIKFFIIVAPPPPSQAHTQAEKQALRLWTIGRAWVVIHLHFLLVGVIHESLSSLDHLAGILLADLEGVGCVSHLARTHKQIRLSGMKMLSIDKRRIRSRTRMRVRME